MGIGASVFLLALGAILAFAVDYSVNGLDINVIGFILMVAGAVGLLMTTLVFGRRDTVAAAASSPRSASCATGASSKPRHHSSRTSERPGSLVDRAFRLPRSGPLSIRVSTAAPSCAHPDGDAPVLLRDVAGRVLGAGVAGGRAGGDVQDALTPAELQLARRSSTRAGALSAAARRDWR